MLRVLDIGLKNSGCGLVFSASGYQFGVWGGMGLERLSKSSPRLVQTGSPGSSKSKDRSNIEHAEDYRVQLKGSK